jgi:hypothetical protein
MPSNKKLLERIRELEEENRDSTLRSRCHEIVKKSVSIRIEVRLGV